MASYIEKLFSQLENIKLLMFDLLDNSRIGRYDDEHIPGLIMIRTSDYYWYKPQEKEQQIQIKLKKEYSKWIDAFRLLTEHSPESIKKKVNSTDKFICDWIEKSNSSSVPGSTSQGKVLFEDKIKFFHNTLSLYLNSGEKKIILVPDTNALITDPEPKNYSVLARAENITIIFLPIVLSELDELKVKASNPEFQKKVKSVISRLKGYRAQGNMLEGVIVEKTICLKMVASEPNFSKTFSWLDKDNNDDKIIASALEIQKDNPSSIVYIVTGDINLQNKAEMGNFSYLDMDK